MTIIDYIFPFFLSFIFGLLITPFVIWLARKYNVIDHPNNERKIHRKNIPLMGGLAIFLAVNGALAVYYYFSNQLFDGSFKPKNLIGILIAGTILMIGGILDDKFNLKPKLQLLFPLLAIMSIIVSGIGIDWVANPFNSQELWRLDESVTILFWFQGLPYKLTLFADIFTLIWLMAMMYTTKLLDGLDGLVSGLAVIGSLFIFLASLVVENPQYNVALLALIFAGAVLAFWLFNFNPAKVFLGEGGSLYIGFMLGVLSIISGSKVAITLIIMGIPLLDMFWTIVRRLMEHKNPLTSADKKHLHHRFLAAGFSVKQTSLILYIISLILGVSALLLQQYNYGYLVVGLAVLLFFMLITGYLYKITKEKS